MSSGRTVFSRSFDTMLLTVVEYDQSAILNPLAQVSLREVFRVWFHPSRHCRKTLRSNTVQSSSQWPEILALACDDPALAENTLHADPGARPSPSSLCTSFNQFLSPASFILVNLVSTLLPSSTLVRFAFLIPTLLSVGRPSASKLLHS